MTPTTHPLGMTPQQRLRLVEDAKREAMRLREQAIDDMLSALRERFRSAFKRAPRASTCPR